MHRMVKFFPQSVLRIYKKVLLYISLLTPNGKFVASNGRICSKKREKLRLISPLVLVSNPAFGTILFIIGVRHDF